MFRLSDLESQPCCLRLSDLENQPHCLFLVPASAKGGGNDITVNRIRSYFLKSNVISYIMYVGTKDEKKCLETFLANHQISVVIAIHAYKTGRILTECVLPYIIILGGTDVNIDTDIKEKFDIMSSVLLHARSVIGFCKELKDAAVKFWPGLIGKIRIIPQGVNVLPSDFSIKDYLSSRSLINTDELFDQLNIFLQAGGIRPVKNYLYLVKEFSDWHSCGRKNTLLLIVGPIVDKEYGELFKRKIDNLAGVVHIEGLPLSDMHAVMKKCFAFVNSSDSEGMSVAILEAMALAVPVIVRDNEGNRSIVDDGQTGLMFNSPSEFISKAETLLNSELLRNSIKQNAAMYIADHHCPKEEERAYIQLIEEICCKKM